MTTGEARVLETDAVIFSADSIPNDLSLKTEQKALNPIKLDDRTKTTKLESRFARLKKSLRKKSVSIL